jgi:hypothetical protein
MKKLAEQYNVLGVGFRLAIPRLGCWFSRYGVCITKSKRVIYHRHRAYSIAFGSAFTGFN